MGLFEISGEKVRWTFFRYKAALLARQIAPCGTARMNYLFCCMICLAREASGLLGNLRINSFMRASAASF